LNNFSKSHHLEAQLGVGYALLAFLSWGILPVYWKLLDNVSSFEILSHRMVWSTVFLLVLIAVQRRLGEFRDLLESRKQIWLLLVTATLLGVNWFVYIYGVNTNRIVETSLGYFINPLLNVLMGILFLKERLEFWRGLAVVLASLGVLNYLWNFGSLPWIALSLAFTFSFYGLLRKVIPVKPLIGLFIETLLLAPLATIFILIWKVEGSGNFGGDWRIAILLIGAGIVTSLPLLWFTNATKRLRYSTVGFIQYLTPSIQLIIGVYLYQEPFTTTHSITFGLIWSGLMIYSIKSLNVQRV